jgi:hypothetical protein
VRKLLPLICSRHFCSRPDLHAPNPLSAPVLEVGDPKELVLFSVSLAADLGYAYASFGRLLPCSLISLSQRTLLLVGFISASHNADLHTTGSPPPALGASVSSSAGRRVLVLPSAAVFCSFHQVAPLRV